MIFTGNPRTAPRCRSEFPRASHDGMIWPLPRDKMQDHAAIIQRMAQDLSTLRRQQASVSHDNLRFIGWTDAQIKRHLLEAVDKAASRGGADAHPAEHHGIPSEAA
jgi:hypothetical protein